VISVAPCFDATKTIGPGLVQLSAADAIAAFDAVAAVAIDDTIASVAPGDKVSVANGKATLTKAVPIDTAIINEVKA